MKKLLSIVLLFMVVMLSGCDNMKAKKITLPDIDMETLPAPVTSKFSSTAYTLTDMDITNAIAVIRPKSTFILFFILCSSFLVVYENRGFFT